jgi:protocatechuate 3,4-dioxygenase, alpha subunit
MTNHRTAAHERPAHVEPMEDHLLTPFQPTGPYPQVMLDLPTGSAVPLSPAARGERIVIEGTLRDGDGTPVVDAMIETWQADAGGRYAHSEDPRHGDVDPAFWGYRRVATDGDGRFRIETIKPGRPLLHRPALSGVEDSVHIRQAPHLLVGVYGGGVLHRYVTRIYFDGEPANAQDAVLALVPESRRHTLIARRDDATYRFDIKLQGEDETVFFEA